MEADGREDANDQAAIGDELVIANPEEALPSIKHG